jgi:hypothetical protein
MPKDKEMHSSATEACRGCLQELQQDILNCVHVTTSVEHILLCPLASYVLELCLLERSMLAFSGPLLAASSVLLARVLLACLRNPNTRRTRRVVVWPVALQVQSGLAAADLEMCTAQQLELLRGVHDEGATAILFRKYSMSAFWKVAKLPFLASMPAKAFEAAVELEFPVQELGPLPDTRIRASQLHGLPLRRG